MSTKKSPPPETAGEKKEPPGKSGFFTLRRLVLLSISAVMFLVVLGGGAAVFMVQKYSVGLPDVLTLKNYKPSLVTTLYDRYDNVMAEYFIEKRILVDYPQIPDHMKLATLAIEDDNFFNHGGIDIKGILRAAAVNLRHGGVVQGGSTITQQVSKQIFLSSERTFERKIKELLLSLRLEQNFSKEEILEIYLNQIYYGHGSYGVEAASQLYYNKHITELTLAEMTLLAGLPKAPNSFSPYNNRDAALERRNLVIKRMHELNYITQEEARHAAAEPLKLAPKQITLNYAPFFAEHIRRYLEKKYGSTSIYREGLKIYTTLDLKWQKTAQDALKKGIEAVDRRLGYRGPAGWMDPQNIDTLDWETLNPPLKNIPESEYYAQGTRLKAVVTDITPKKIEFVMNGRKGGIDANGFSWAHPPDPKEDGRWARKINDATKLGLKAGDIIEVKIKEITEDGQMKMELDQFPAVQGALVSIDHATGGVRSMVGGYEFGDSSFNRAVQAYRQPGSAFKPIIYSAALDKGFTPASIVIDSPIIFEEDIGDFKNWKPVNFKEKFYGPTTIRTAVTHSRNIVTIKVLQKIGIPYVVDFAKRLGITSYLEPNLSLALGSSSVNLMEMTSVYGVFANGGVKNEPFYIRRIEDRYGRIVEEHKEDPVKVLSEDTAFLMNSILQGVVQEGTGQKVKSVGVPAGGKTGTTNDFLDAWFIGFTPDIACGVWIGKDREERLGKNETGSRAASPIWLAYMEEVVRDLPVKPFVPPSNIVFVKTEKETGKLARPETADTIFESFKEGTQPTDYIETESMQ